jgi:hypothetical protein
VPDTESLKDELTAAGIDPDTVQLRLVPAYFVDLGETDGG